MAPPSHTAPDDARPKRRRRVRWKLLLAIVLAFYIIYLAGLYTVQRKLIYPRRLAGPAVGPPIGVQLLVIEPEPGVRVEGWFWPAIMPGIPDDSRPAGSDAPSSSSEPVERPAAPLAVLFHGNAETTAGMMSLATLYQSLGFAVLAPEYRGYSRSGGKPSQAALTRDAIALIDAAIASQAEDAGEDPAVRLVDPGRILYHGRSVGAGVACSAAAARAPSAIVLESAFTSLSSMVWRFGAPPFLVKDPYRNDNVLRAYGGPVLIFHGKDDLIIPPRHGRALAELAKHATHIELPGGHNDFPQDHDAYARALREFVAPLAQPMPNSHPETRR